MAIIQALEASADCITSAESILVEPEATAIEELKAEEAEVQVKKPLFFQIDYVQGMRPMPSRLAERMEPKPEIKKSNHQQLALTDEDELLMDEILAKCEANEKRKRLEEQQRVAQLLREENLQSVREKAKSLQSRPPTRAGKGRNEGEG